LGGRAAASGIGGIDAYQFLIFKVWTRRTASMSTNREKKLNGRAMSFKPSPAWILAATGGGVDAVFFLSFEVLTAAQTGNTILLAVALVQGQLDAGFSGALSLIAFLVGAVLAGGIARFLKSKIALLLAIEALTLCALAVVWHFKASPLTPTMGNVLIATAAACMGWQSSVMLTLRSRSTTYMTGILTTFAHALIVRGGARMSHSPDPTDSPWPYGLTWLIYFSGALLTGGLFLKCGPLALLLPIACLLIGGFFSTKRLD